MRRLVIVSLCAALGGLLTVSASFAMKHETRWRFRSCMADHNGEPRLVCRDRVIQLTQDMLRGKPAIMLAQDNQLACQWQSDVSLFRETVIPESLDCEKSS